jgi:hypothetical protein
MSQYLVIMMKPKICICCLIPEWLHTEEKSKLCMKKIRERQGFYLAQTEFLFKYTD